MKILFCFGTRPEIIKLAMLVNKCSKLFDVKTVFTGQHVSLFDAVKHLIPRIDFHIQVPKDRNLNELSSLIMAELNSIFLKEKPDLVVVQGDTTSALCAALCAFHLGIKIGHVEAGLRTYDLSSPFPEEFNRQAISKMAFYNWCPSEGAAKNLYDEGAPGIIFLTGNTIVDYIREHDYRSHITYGNDVIVTLHRRENEFLFSKILAELNVVALMHPELKFIFPCHPNPIIRSKLFILKASNIKIIEPMGYEDFLELLAGCKCIITDSGGIQEEALCFKKRVLVCRDNTERIEGVNVGLCKLVGDNIMANFNWALLPVDFDVVNPYGDGYACNKIVDILNAN